MTNHIWATIGIIKKAFIATQTIITKKERNKLNAKIKKIMCWQLQRYENLENIPGNIEYEIMRINKDDINGILKTATELAKLDMKIWEKLRELDMVIWISKNQVSFRVKDNPIVIVFKHQKDKPKTNKNPITNKVFWWIRKQLRNETCVNNKDTESNNKTENNDNNRETEETINENDINYKHHFIHKEPQNQKNTYQNIPSNITVINKLKPDTLSHSLEMMQPTTPPGTPPTKRRKSRKEMKIEKIHKTKTRLELDLETGQEKHVIQIETIDLIDLVSNGENDEIDTDEDSDTLYIVTDDQSHITTSGGQSHNTTSGVSTSTDKITAENTMGTTIKQL